MTDFEEGSKILKPILFKICLRLANRDCSEINESIIDKVLDNNKEIVIKFYQNRQKTIKYCMGQVLKENLNINPQMLKQILEDEIDKI